jgi:hypothetical protein
MALGIVYDRWNIGGFMKWLVVLLLFISSSAVANVDSVFTDVFPVESLSAGSDFDQFKFKVLGDCKQINTVWFQSFATHTEPVIGTDQQGRDVVAGIKFNLFEDGTYWGEYNESAVVERTPQGTSFAPILNKVIQGTWRVSGPKLIVQYGREPIGEGMLVTINNIVKVTFKFTKAIGDSRLVGTSAVLGQVITNIGPRGESINKFCGVR